MSRTRLRSILTALIVATSLAPAWAETVVLQGEAAGALQRGKHLLQRRHYHKAAAEFERASDLAGGSCSECLLGVGRAYQGAGQIDAAIQVTRMGLSMLSAPEERAKAYNQLGSLLVLKGDREAAQEAFRKAASQMSRATAP
jgi:tetratricopeptide (TPR) repeat protein